MSRALLANEQGGPLAQQTVTPRQSLLQQTLGAVVVHTAAVLLCRQGVDLLRPLINMLLNPAALVVSTYIGVFQFTGILLQLSSVDNTTKFWYVCTVRQMIIPQAQF